MDCDRVIKKFDLLLVITVLLLGFSGRIVQASDMYPIGGSYVFDDEEHYLTTYSEESNLYYFIPFEDISKLFVAEPIEFASAGLSAKDVTDFLERDSIGIDEVEYTGTYQQADGYRWITCRAFLEDAWYDSVLMYYDTHALRVSADAEAKDDLLIFMEKIHIAGWQPGVKNDANAVSPEVDLITLNSEYSLINPGSYTVNSPEDNAYIITDTETITIYAMNMSKISDYWSDLDSSLVITLFRTLWQTMDESVIGSGRVTGEPKDLANGIFYVPMVSKSDYGELESAMLFYDDDVIMIIAMIGTQENVEKLANNIVPSGMDMTGLQGTADSVENNVGTNDQTDDAVPEVGDLIILGHYEQDNNISNGPEPVEWQVLAVENDRMLVASRYILDVVRYNEDYASVTWEDSTLRTWMNGSFFDSAFTAEDKSRILTVTNENPDNPDWGTAGGNATNDHIFALSNEEAAAYFDSNDARKCRSTDYAKAKGAFVQEDTGASWWWLRSPGNSLTYAAAGIDGDGIITLIGFPVHLVNVAVRPACWISLNGSAGGTGTVSADTGSVGQQASTGERVSLTKGSTVKFGRYEQDNDAVDGPESIEWEVLTVEDGKALLLSKYALDSKPYYPEWEKVSWETCLLRSWLNGWFYNTAFTENEQKQIILSELDNYDYLYDTDRGGNATQDHVFLLSYTEGQKYYPKNESDLCEATEYAKAVGAGYRYGGKYEWWLRSQGRLDNFFMSGFDSYSNETQNSSVMVRPAIWVPETLILESENEQPARKDLFEGTAPEFPADVRAGQFVEFGRYEQDNDPFNGPESIEWQVLEVSGGQILLISKYGLDVKPYHTEPFENVTWEESGIRAWLNGWFYNTAFNAAEQDRIILSSVVNNTNNPTHGSNGGNNTEDHVFFLSIDEVGSYNQISGAIPTEYAKGCGAKLQSGKASWWLRSPGLDNTWAAVISYFSDMDYQGETTYQSGVTLRPVIRVNYK